MSAYKIDDEQGFDFSSGNIELAYGPEAIAIDSQVVCLQLLGENPLSVRQGIDYLGRVFNGAGNAIALGAMLRNEILLRVDGAVSVDNFSAEIVGDTIVYTQDINGISQETITANITGV